MKGITNIGVQLMPIVLIIAAVAFYALGSNAYCLSCVILAVAFFLVLSSEKYKD